jgi:sterol desaturase/sphingolipid hydroxylase (fatty acid hydroxylase superfamily)
MMRGVLQRLVFPLLFGSAITLAWWGINAGHDAGLVVFVITIAAGLFVTILERLMPYEAAWSESHGDVPTDLFYVFASLVAAPRLFEPLALALLVKGAAALSVGWALWPDQLPWGVQVVLAVVIGEFGSYWWHRLMHERPLLFRLHATHHSALRLYWLNSTRFHPFDNVVMYGFQIAPLLIVGASESVLVGFTVWSLVHGFCQHANVDVRLGPLNYFFSMSELHRWHHSREISEANHNYGSNCILWDLVFGTFFWPEKKPPVNVGLSDLDAFPQRVLGQILSPFFWPTGRTRKND